ncbi:MAG TPA: pitrilysin family protein [Terriglobales bacterium]|nr:pitrilysin family protein [Terriglobales bacterium]
MKLHTHALRGTLSAALVLALGTGAMAQTAAKPAAKAAAPAKTAAAAKGFTVPVEYYKLKNGLRVILSPDHTSPTVTTAVYYRIGFRIEPKNRTGFAHLFEHLMFQGSQNLGKMEFIQLVQKNGGTLNGSTRFDFTNYFEILPAHKLETALWAEADRMRGLAINEDNLKNQQGVVGNEVKVNVINRPYGGFPWLDMPQYANTNWFNSHNFYGDLKDIEAATLEDAKDFFSKYYAPNNAALAIVGDFDPAEAKQFVEKYFANIPSAETQAIPDLTEPRQETEKQASKVDALAKRPALAIAYHMPDRNTPEYFAMALLDQILLQGDDALLRDEIVKKRGMTDSVSGGINLLGSAYNYNGPMLWTVSLFHDAKDTPANITSALDTVIENVRTKPLSQDYIDRALVKTRSGLYDTLGSGFGRADLLASLALFDDNPARINNLESELKKVTPALIQKTAQEYLRPGNRTILAVKTKEAK